MSIDATEVSNYIVVIHGRGVLHACIAKGTLEQVTEKAEGCLLSGFEVHMYSLKLAEHTTHLTYLPSGINLLREEFHMWDAAEEITDMVNGIKMHMDSHTTGMSKIYLQQAIEELQAELDKISAGPGTQVSEPTFDAPESKATGT